METDLNFFREDEQAVEMGETFFRYGITKARTEKVSWWRWIINKIKQLVA